VSAPWGHPEANPLADIREFMRRAEQQYRSSFGVPPPAIGPDPLRCPACGMTRRRCLQVFGRGGQHEFVIIEALRLEEPGG
jgi:hypothetical protein